MDLRVKEEAQDADAAWQAAAVLSEIAEAFAEPEAVGPSREEKKKKKEEEEEKKKKKKEKKKMSIALEA